jgi:hypothetical protein
MASGLFLALLILVVAICIAVSMKERPILGLIRRRWPGLAAEVDDTTVLLGALLLFDLLATGLLVRFGTHLG